MPDEQKCPNPLCLNGQVYENVDGKRVVRICPTCGGKGTVPRQA